MAKVIEMAFLSPLPLRQLRTTTVAKQVNHHAPPRCPRRMHSVRMGLLDKLKKAISGDDYSGDPEIDPVLGTSPDDPGANRLPAYNRRVKRINDLEDGIEEMSDEEMAARVAEIRESLRSGAKKLDAVLEEIFALVREATFRVLGLRHYDVQLVGGMVLHDASVAEMATGEGKTIVAALPSCLNALTGEGVFVVTVNDYLARRDAELVGQVHKFLGLSVGLIQAGMKPLERREAYSCDITYVTNSELGFDYLRDNLAMTEEDIVLTRPLGFCIVDEADSILIDEARTPLIISERTPAPTQKYETAKKAADMLTQNVHYTVDEKEQNVLLTERGYTDLEQALKVDGLFDAKNPWASFITNALKAKEVFKRDVNYILGEDEESSKLEVQIVDEFTGRIMKGRRWSDGLHQAVEAKEGIIVDSEALTAAKISYQSFFKLFQKLAGMTGTAATESSELKDIYDLSVVVVPTALPLARKSYPDVVFRSAEGKYRGIMREIAQVAPTGRPILIGTTSVEASESLSALLDDVEVGHFVLNAKPESALRESEIVAQAGRKYALTIATNMAGRGTDILLGGNAEYFARALARREVAANSSELFEELSDPENPILIDNEALPADVSEEAVAQLSRAAEIVSKSLGARSGSLAAIDEVVGIAAEYGPIPDGVDGTLELREAMAAIKEELDETVKAEREEVLDLGGLYVIGTERAESRRVDNQLRGRAGRQGDPGGSRFFLGLDDRLFRVFGGDKVTGILESFRVGEDTPIENPLVNNTLDNAQKNVESYFREIRDQLFTYDEVFSTQRSAFYVQRRKVVVGEDEPLTERLRSDCMDTAKEIISGYVRRRGAADDYEKLCAKLLQFFDGLQGVSSAELESASNLEQYVSKQIDLLLEEKRSVLESLKEGFGKEVMRYLWLVQMDKLWQEHMKSLDYVKEFVVLRAYEGEDPLQIYQKDGYELFTDMLASVRRNSVYSYFQYQSSAEGAVLEKYAVQ